VRKLLYLATLCVILLVCGLVRAQGTNATLSGTVTDNTGAVIPGATISAQNVRTGVVINTTTNESGVYIFPSLQPGIYEVTAEKSGFRKLAYNEVTLEVSARVALNFQLEVGTVTESVDVRADVDTRLALGTSSVGGVVTGQQVRDLPLPNRNALGLVSVHAGLVGDNLSGARIGTLNITRDGINVQDNRINSGVASTIFTSTDLIEEFRIVTSPADAEFGRGSGQIQMITRSGTNEFHGSLFESHRNTALNANTWFNNQRGHDPVTGAPISPRNILIRNQFGGRIGGPIIRNRTFFHVLYEGQHIRQKNSVTSTVFTQPARQGIFRFFPGVRNGNANAAVPTVDLAGNPVRPASATGDLQSVSLFGRDPNRSAPDRSGVIQRMISLMPLPNNFRTGDGLNTAGFTWIRSQSDDFKHLSLRFDHQFDDRHRLTFSYTRENGDAKNSFLAQPFPDSPGGNSLSRDRFYSLSIISTFKPTLLNEFRIGALRPLLRFFAPWELEGGSNVQPSAGNQLYLIDFASVTDPINVSNDPQGRITPVYQFSDTLTWLRGRHAFKGGAEVRFVSTNGFNSFDVTPRAVLGTGGVAIQNINNIPGIGQNNTAAQSMLNDLSGSIGSLRQAFNAPGGPNPNFLAGEVKYRNWRSRELAMFFKDDMRLSPSLTLNLGVRWEFFGVPYDANGKTAAVVGGTAGIFGISGASMADLFQPGRMNGSLSRVQTVGPNSANPDAKLYNDDWNNFAPAVGLSWSIPFLGKDKTVLRMGYGIGYERNSLRIIDVLGSDLPGLRTVTTLVPGSYLDLTRITLPLQPAGKPLDTVPITERTQTLRGFDTNLRLPYVQNWNISIQRELARRTLLEVRYVGNKGTKLVRGFDINEVNIFETGILEAFLTTMAGGHSPLLDRIFMGLNIPGLGVVDGRRITGSDVVRFNTTTQGHLASNGVASFADFLNRSTQFTGEVGGLLRRAGLPENFIIANPQFLSSRLTANTANSTYHSLQVEVTKRFTSGWQLQSNYTWSRALGEEEGDGQEIIDSYRNLRNWRLDKRLMDFHITHVWRNSGSVELPFGPKRKFLNGNNPVVSRLVGGWVIGAIFNVFSGSPISLSSGVNSYNTFGDNTPVIVGQLPKSFGAVEKDGNGVFYFGGLQRVPDPSIANMPANIRPLSTLTAIADSSGRLILVNPTPGQLGTLAPFYLEGPGSFRFDVSLSKRIRIGESKELEFRADATNVTNSPQWNNPNTDINSSNFGRITGAGGNRIIIVGIRVNF